jgi:hypothetical protein
VDEKITCGMCKWCYKEYEQLEGFPISYKVKKAECRRHPPRFVLDCLADRNGEYGKIFDALFYSRFPIVTLDEWCGEAESEIRWASEKELLKQEV